MFVLRTVLMLAVVVALAACQTTGSAVPGASAASLTTGTAPSMGRNMAEGPRTAPPIGYIGFCLRHRDECDLQPAITGSVPAATPVALAAPAPVSLTSAAWQELNKVNEFVNRTVRPVSDQDLVGKAEWWSYPIGNAGDCEDYVLEKRRLLMERGWPADALLISVVRQWNGEGHAVLTVVTDKGDLVLDNMARGIVAWEKAPYTWLMRQSRTHPMHWVKLNGAGAPDRVASTSSSSLAGGPSGL